MDHIDAMTNRNVMRCIKVGRGHWDACVGTWDLGTSSIGHGDVWDGDAGRQIQESGGR